MGMLLNKLVTEYYSVHKEDGDSRIGALTVMKAIEKEVVDEILRENAEAALEREVSVREAQRRKEPEEMFKESIRSFRYLLLEGVALATVIGLIGSHLYGLGGAWCYSPTPDFNYLVSVVVLVFLVLACISLLFYMSVYSLPEWIIHAMGRDNDEWGFDGAGPWYL